MSKSGTTIAIVALIFSALSLYAVTARPAEAENAVGQKTLKVAVVNYAQLSKEAKIVSDRETAATQIIKNIYGKYIDEIKEEEQDLNDQIKELGAKTIQERDLRKEERLERKKKLLSEKGKQLKNEMKTAQSMLQVRFRAHAMAGILLEIESYAKMNSFDLVMNRTSLLDAASEDANEDSTDELIRAQRFSSNVNNSTLLYFNGKDDKDPRRKFTIADITKRVAEKLEKQGWEEMKERVLKYLNEE